MSGELRNPKRNIPLGTMAAIGLSLLIYMALAFWLARSVSADELVRNYTVMIDHAYYGPLVLAGLLAATFSSGLVSFSWRTAHFAMAVLVAIYIMLLRRDLSAPFGDVRSGIVMALAEWAAKRMHMMEGSHERVWKLHLLVPTDDASELLGINRLVYELAHPSGSVKLLGINKDKNFRKLHNSLKKAKEAFQKEGIFCAESTLHSQNFAEGLRPGMEALSGIIFRPNVLFLTLPTDKSLQRELDERKAL